MLKSLYVSIVTYQIEQEKFMDLSRKVKPLPININFLVRLILSFVFKPYAPKLAWRIFPIVAIRAMVERSHSWYGEFDV